MADCERVMPDDMRTQFVLEMAGRVTAAVSQYPLDPVLSAISEAVMPQLTPAMIQMLLVQNAQQAEEQQNNRPDDKTAQLREVQASRDARNQEYRDSISKLYQGQAHG